MVPELRQDRSALRWIRGELDQTLREARTSLEDFVEGSRDRLDNCVDLLHHVHGALDMVQVYGGSMLADEMEQLALALSQGQVKRVDAAAEALMLAMVQLPAYLEKIEAGGADIPLVLLPLMNDLRAAHDAPLVSETSLFAPKLNAVIAAETVRPGSGNRDLPRLIHGQRSHYHRGLLNWIRGQDVPVALGHIRDVLDVLNSAAGTARFRRLLDAGEALAIALLEDDEAPALAVKPLFGKLDRVLKHIIDQGEEATMLDFPVDLLKNMLYYIARSSSKDPAVLAVKQAADLANNFPEQGNDGSAAGSLGGPDRELFQAVGDALAQDLRDVKDQLDLYMRSDRQQLDRLTNLAQPIQRIGDTLGMVGRGELRSRLRHRCDELRAAERSAEPLPDTRLMSLASDLLLVESSLASLASGAELAVDFDEPMEGTVSQSLSEGELQQHLRSAIEEASVELARTKDAILEFLDKPDQTALLNEVPARLHTVAGVLQMLELPEAGRLLAALKPYIAGLANGQEPIPDAGQRDALADVVISAECYMQTAVEPGEDRTRLLSYAQAALGRLGLGDAGVSTAPAEADAAQPEPLELAEPVELAQAPEPVEPAELAGAAEPQAEAVAADEIPRGADGESLEEAAGDEEADAIDPEILEVFSEEAAEELASIQDCYPKWRDNRDDRESLATMRRSFHTLKGSGRIVGASNIGEFSWAVENLLNRVIDGTVEAGTSLIQLMDDVLEVLPQLVAEATRSGAGGKDVSAIAARAFVLASGETEDAESVAPVEAGQADVATSASEPAITEDVAEMAPEPSAGSEPDSGAEEPGMAADLSFLEIDQAVSHEAGSAGAAPPSHEPDGASLSGYGEIADESILTDAEAQDSEFLEVEPTTLSIPDSSLNAVFLNEAQGHLQVLADFIGHCREHAGDCAFDEGVRRAMHTLRGSSRTAGVPEMAEVAAALEDYSNAMYGLQREADEEVCDLLGRSHRVLCELAATVDDPHLEVPGWEALRDEINRHVAGLAHGVPDLEEAAEASSELQDLHDSEMPFPPQGMPDKRDDLSESQEAPDPELLEIFLEEAKELLEALEGELADWETAVDDRRPVAQLQRTLHTMKGGARLSGVSAVGDLSHALESVFESVIEQRIADNEPLRRLVRHATDALAQSVEQLIRDEPPSAHEAMIEGLEAAARGRDWEGVVVPEPAPLQPVPTAPLEPEPAQSPELAQSPEPVQSPEPAGLSPDTRRLQEDFPAGDDLDADSELLTDSQLMTDSELLSDSSFAPGVPAGGAEAAVLAGAVNHDSTVVQFPTAGQHVDGEGFVPRRPLPEDEPPAAVGSERVRVASEALDQMVNNAGEVSIYRARLEQQNNTFAFNLGELQQTTDRLRSQLRDLELETEAQILSRHEREGEARADFDPLELDRYSTIQQLSRALSETVEDLSNLGHTLSDLSRDTDTLLLQQARVTTDLQDSLLRTRMVKFSSRVPRLERVVRQTSHSVGKQAGLEVLGGEEDMDRAILERMMSPFEHLLRNAVSHGIEDTNTRLANGKPPQGTISLHLAREGSDLVLTLSDDGAGLDRARIRSKAVERGLIESDAVIDDDDLYQLILQPGFSTAQELSQVSGRGVGMDVVLTEIKQLGGSLEIDSQPGRGTSFTIRLPFTLAITDSLLVALGDEIYAVPHSSMDGVVRVSLDELRAIYAGEQNGFRYGDRDYSVRHLSAMLGTQVPQLGESLRWLPLLLVRSGEHRVAIQVDNLLGNRQIVVKSVGAQLSTVRWFTGGTILADGQIALILDVNSLVRMDSAQPPMAPSTASAPMSKGVSVMVVDDSITVRKVTSRLLERHNMQVVTAKDGVDAVTLLQEHHPDVMLLDIEMPRMDGYELARHMRSTPELADIPIIMITSRTGDKHRNRALDLGVKRYLGKPYQEADLLENIYTVLADTAL